jgi:hypothetical protein
LNPFFKGNRNTLVEGVLEVLNTILNCTWGKHMRGLSGYPNRGGERAGFFLSVLETSLESLFKDISFRRISAGELAAVVFLDSVYSHPVRSFSQIVQEISIMK